VERFCPRWTVLCSATLSIGETDRSSASGRGPGATDTCSEVLKPESLRWKGSVRRLADRFWTVSRYSWTHCHGVLVQIEQGCIVKRGRLTRRLPKASPASVIIADSRPFCEVRQGRSIRRADEPSKRMTSTRPAHTVVATPPTCNSCNADLRSATRPTNQRRGPTAVRLRGVWRSHLATRAPVFA
jgi:hypothetical protein